MAPYFGWFEKQRTQQIGITIHTWNFQITGHDPSDISRELHWNGFARQQHTADKPCKVDGYFRSTSDGDTRNVFRLSRMSRPAIILSIGLPESAYNQCVMLFSTVLPCEAGKVLLALELTHEKWAEPEFWDKRWETQELTIASYRLNIEGQSENIIDLIGR